jgi:hypothetical protein
MTPAPSLKRARPEEEEKEDEIKVVQSGIDTKNVHVYYVGFENYAADPTCEAALPPRDTWYTNARFRPESNEVCQTMHVDEALIWRALNAGCHIIISGKAGAGKSNLLQRFVGHLKTAGVKFELTAPTGIAAFNIGGETIHRRLGLGLAADDAVKLFQMISKNPRKYMKTWKFLTNTDILIIDEISMVHADFFNKLEYLFRKARKNEQPFGGLRLMVVGDFTQLGPISDRRNDDQHHARYVLETEVWQRMQFSRIFLDRSYRQNSGAFLDLLNEVRQGHLSAQGKRTLLSRLNVDLDLSTTVTFDRSIQQANSEDNTEAIVKSIRMEPLTVYPYKVQVERCNKQRLDELVERDKVEVHRFYPALRVAKKEHVTLLDPADLERGNYLLGSEGRKQVEDYFPLFQIILAVGAQVMMRCNRHLDVGIANGTPGIVVNVAPDFVSVLFVVNGKFMQKPIDVTRAEFSASVGKTAEIIMTQFPLTLAWASTVHKCVAGDSWLFTGEGMTQIQDVASEDGWHEDKTTLATREQEVEVTSAVYRAPESQLSVIITTRAGFRLEGSLEHAILVQSKSQPTPDWSLMSFLKEGDMAAMRCGMKLASTDYVPIPLEMRHLFHSPVVTEDLGYMIGWLCTNESFGFDLSLPVSNELLQPVLFKRWTSASTVSPNEDKESFQLPTSTDLDAFWDWVGVRDHVIPAVILESPLSVQSAFLRALVDHDGYLHTSMHLWSVSTRFLQQVQMLLLNHGVISSITDNYTLNVDSEEMAYLRSATMGTDCDVPEQEPPVERTWWTDEIVSIAQGKCRMFDLTVPGSHSYVSNGFVSHNCQGLTLERVRIDGSSMFEQGQLYVALSRVRELEHLSLISFKESSLLANASTVEFETRNE